MFVSLNRALEISTHNTICVVSIKCMLRNKGHLIAACVLHWYQQLNTDKIHFDSCSIKQMSKSYLLIQADFISDEKINDKLPFCHQSRSGFIKCLIKSKYYCSIHLLLLYIIQISSAK